MFKHAKQFGGALRHFGGDEEGAQVVEYALVIAVVSIALVVALQALTTGGSFSQLITRIGNCLSAGGTCT